MRTKMSKDSVSLGGTIYVGAMFFEVIMIMFIGMAEMSMTIAKLPLFYIQRDLHFFPAWAYGLLNWILKVSLAFVKVVVRVFTTYYVIGYDPNVGRLFKQFLLLVLVNQAANGLFRFIGAPGRIMIIASTFGAFTFLFMYALAVVGAKFSQMLPNHWVLQF
ncbi:hypothetical protein Drorol1_Dr00018239 [Drosera rotundifolia]